MYAKWISSVCILAVGLLASPAGADELKVGDKAPDFSLKGEGAATVNLSEYEGKKLVLTFNRANWCPFCLKQIVDLQKHYEAIQDAGAELLVVWREEATGTEGLKKIRETTKATMPFALDLEAEKTGAYSPEGYDAYVIDEEGTIIAILEGTKPDRALGGEILKVLREK